MLSLMFVIMAFIYFCLGGKEKEDGATLMLFGTGALFLVLACLFAGSEF